MSYTLLVRDKTFYGNIKWHLIKSKLWHHLFYLLPWFGKDVTLRGKPQEFTNSERIIIWEKEYNKRLQRQQPWSLLRLHTVTHMLTLFDYNFVQNNSMYTLWFSLDILWTLYKYGMFQIHLWIRSLLQICYFNN